MKLIFENIRPDADSSFRIFSPQLNDFFFWHYHPEYEIVYIEGADGTRHIGDHLSRFEQSDLVFIGPYIPHLNFDYGIKTPYQKIVIQMREDFLTKAFSLVPELSQIHALFEKAKQGIYFTSETKQRIGERLKKLTELPHFEQLIEMLAIFQDMATSPDLTVINAKPIEAQYKLKEQQRLKIVYAYIEEHYKDKIDIVQMAQLTHLTHAGFCRYFKKMTLMTFTEFVNQYRINQAKNLLLSGKTVSEVCFDCGFESLSYFNRIFKKVVGENPLQFKKTYLVNQLVAK
jgi:AraC-like DNA-binding protein